MLKLAARKPTVVDPLRVCIEWVLEYHQRRTDLTDIAAELPNAGKRWSIATLPAVAERLDCQLKIVKANAEELQCTKAPVILPLRGNLFAVVVPTDAEFADVVLPGTPPEPLSDAHLESWCTGRVILLTPAQIDSTAATDHMHTDRSIDWFWQPILKYTLNFFEVIVCTVFINMLVIALPLFTLNVYDSVVPNLAMSTLTVLAIGVGIAILFDVILKSARTSTLERIAARTGTTFDRELMKRMLSIREEQMHLSVGERCNLFRELQGLRDFYATRLVPALVDFPFFLLFLLVIYLISPALTFVPIGIALSILALNLLVQIPVKRSTKNSFESTQKKSSMMVETLSGSVALKQLNATGITLNRWNITADKAADASRRSQRWVSFGQHGSLGLMQLNHVLIVVVGVYQIQNGSLTVGGLVASTILASRTIAPIMALHSVIARWTQSGDCLRAIDELFTREVDRSKSRVQPGKALQGSICVRDFSYTYQDQSLPAVKTMNLTISAGERICLVGPSGAGKSTLARAIAGALVSENGHITIDDYDYRELSGARLRESIALIPQHPFFVSGTVRENLTLGLTHCTDEKIATAATLAGLDTVLVNSGSGLDTDIGENGNKLSGGQKQAISIARAILRDPRVLVFDEPTNGLDSALEQHFMQTMQAFARNRTLIMVTHRMSLLTLAERVIVMDKGLVVADDTKEAVMPRLAA